MSIFHKFFVLSVNLLTIMVISCSCDEEPTKPSEPPSEEHLFFVCAEYSGIVKVFSVEQQKFIDSLEFEAEGPSVEVIGSDEKLLVIADIPQLFDLKTKTTVQTFPDAVAVTASPDGRYLAFNKKTSVPYSYRLELRSFDQQILYHQDTLVRTISFSIDSRLMAYRKEWEDPFKAELVIYELGLDSIIDNGTKYLSNGYPLDRILWVMAPLSKRNKVVFEANDFFLCIADIGSDTARVLKTKLPSAASAIAVSPDEQYLYVTFHPGWDMFPPSKKIFVFDLVTEQLIDSMIVTEPYYEPDQLAITWDGKYIMTCTPSVIRKVGLFDVITGQEIGYYDFNVPGDYPVVAAAKRLK